MIIIIILIGIQINQKMPICYFMKKLISKIFKLKELMKNVYKIKSSKRI